MHISQILTLLLLSDASGSRWQIIPVERCCMHNMHNGIHIHSTGHPPKSSFQNFPIEHPPHLLCHSGPFGPIWTFWALSTILGHFRLCWAFWVIRAILEHLGSICSICFKLLTHCNLFSTTIYSCVPVHASRYLFWSQRVRP